MKKTLIYISALIIITGICTSPLLAQFTIPNSTPQSPIDASSGFNGTWETELHDGNSTENGVTETPINDFCGIDVSIDPLEVNREPKLVRLMICANGNMVTGNIRVIMGNIMDVGKRRNKAVIGDTSPANRNLRRAMVINSILAEDLVDINDNSRFATLILRRGMSIYNLPLTIFEDGDLEVETINDLSASGIEVNDGDLIGNLSGNFSTCPDEFALGIWKKVSDNPNCP